MGAIFYAELPDILSSAGVRVSVGSVNAGWETRARSSGGWDATPLAVFWHHTASQTKIENDLAWQCHNCPDKPVGNMTIDRSGVVWPVAAGASNCAGKGGPASFSRGTIPQDRGNTMGWQIEVANNGVGEPWPVEQIDAYFASSNALNAYFGNQPEDCITHHVWAPTRKIDPATAAAVQGPWRPGSVNSNGTWALDDIRAECRARSHSSPIPIPPGGDDMVDGIYKTNGNAHYLCWLSGNKIWLQDNTMVAAAQAYCRLNGRPDQVHDMSGDLAYFAILGIVSGPRPAGTDEWGNFTDGRP